MKKMTYRIWRQAVYLLLISISLSALIVKAQEGSIFTDQILSGINIINVHWAIDNARTIAIRARPSRNIFILDDNLNQIASFDPFSDPMIPEEGGGGVMGLDWNPAGTHLVVRMSETRIGDILQIWNVSAGTLNSFPIETLVNVVWSPQGDKLSIQTEGSVIIWSWDAQNPENPSILHEFTLPGIPVIQSAVWKPDGSQIAVVNIRGMLRIWDVTTGDIVMELNADNAFLEYDEIVTMGKPNYWSLSWEPNSDRLAVFDRTNNKVEIWDTSSETILNSFSIPDALVSVSWGVGGLLTRSQTIKVWDIATGNLLQGISPNTYERFQFVRWHPIHPELFYTVSAPNLEFQDLLHTIPAPQQTLSIIGMAIVDSDTGEDIHQLVDGDIVDLAALGSSNLAIEGDALPLAAGSVVFDLNGTIKTDDTAPYELTNWMPTPGQYTLTATPYTQAGGTGTAGIPLTINFTVIDSSTACDTTIPAADTTSLIAAIASANGAGTPQTLCLTNSTYTFNAAPDITGDITIVGNGATIVFEAGSGFEMAGDGTLRLEHVTVIRGDDGGG